MFFLFQNEIDYLVDSFTFEVHDAVIEINDDIKKTVFSQCNRIDTWKPSSFFDKNLIGLDNNIVEQTSKLLDDMNDGDILDIATNNVVAVYTSVLMS